MTLLCAFPRCARPARIINANELETKNMYECNDSRFSLNRLHFRFISQQTLSYALRTLGIRNELHGIIMTFIIFFFFY